MSIVNEIKIREQHFFDMFRIMPSALEIDVESYAMLVDELGLDPLEDDILLWESYKLIVNDYSEGKRLKFILSEDL